MNLADIFEDAFKYPFKDWKNWVLFGILIVIFNLGTIFSFYDFSIPVDLSLGLLVFYIIGSIFITGYIISIINFTLNKNDKVPNLNFKRDGKFGLKYLIVSIVYSFILMVILAMAIFLDFILEFFTHVNIFSVITSFESFSGFLNYFGPFSIVLGIVGLILVIIFSVFIFLSLCRIAKYDSISEGLDFFEIYRNIRSIGWFKFFIYFIFLVVFFFIMIMAIVVFDLIPYMGFVLGVLLCTSFFNMFLARSLGLLYSELNGEENIVKTGVGSENIYDELISDDFVEINEK